ncbi:FadR/GntR family transcriptional regulator [Solitalea canadensis]|uniref:Transcriptional regulator n=1 Tax=Solitalea canadensis (strain ATCC 29591 / DSM 3403 / JCM 21819 / LMG 8368 / NBRC 15130 / NCIMB 12057 / USAM 9D) TaxID=929556 RepID=H8KN90_SOLCM|nr:FadR/GntR family transcriptional regulator [Solitalea canadensis]AFD09423.1 transcriptional regulator [Solitalea canadensis DSM 3403]
MNNLAIIKRKSLADEVADRIKEMITSGNYTIGDKLPTEPELMQQFGVGRSSIREAMKILSNNGFTRVQQGTGTFVTSLIGNAEMLSNCLNKARYEELNEVRFFLEEKIVDKAVLQRTDANIEKMRHFLELRKKYAAEQNIVDTIQADIDFHTTIAEAAGNTIMLELYQTVAQHIKSAFSQIHKDTTAFIESQTVHEALLQAIIDKNATKAVLLAAGISQQKK